MTEENYLTDPETNEAYVKESKKRNKKKDKTKEKKGYPYKRKSLRGKK